MEAERQQAEVQSVRKKMPGLSLPTLLPFAIFIVIYAVVPRFAGDKHLTMFIYIGIYAILALGLNLLMGYAGQISLGHAAFFGLGAYTSAILTVRPIQPEVIPGFSVGVGLMAGFAVLIGLTRITGWRLLVGAAGLLVAAWIARLLLMGTPMAVLAYAVVLALTGFVIRANWWKSAIAGAVGALVIAICHGYLGRVFERGGASPWNAMVVGIFFTGLIAYLIGGQVLRLKGHYLAMATLGFGIIVEIVFKQWIAVTGGSSDGIYGISSIDLPGPVRKLFQMVGGGPLEPKQQYFYLVWGFVFITLVLAVNIVRSRVGRAFRAVHGSEVAAETLGVDTERYKVQVFVLSAALASVAGSLYAHNAGIGYISPSEFSFLVSVQLVAMVVIGGMASIWGALFGATMIQYLKNWVLNVGKSDPHFFGLTLNGLEPLIFGSILILVMIILPQGLVRGTADIVAASWRAARRAARKAE